MTEHPQKAQKQFFAVSGSLRTASSCTALLQAAAALAPDGITLTLFHELGSLPYFNPDMDTETPPPAVADFRARLHAADAVLMCSPEYAHGVPGVLKNALDWIVGSGEMVNKPVALFNARARSTFAQASLQETLTVMMAQINAEASLAVTLPGNAVTTADILTDSALCRALRKALDALACAVETQKT